MPRVSSHRPVLARAYRTAWTVIAGALCALGNAVCWWLLGPGATLTLAAGTAVLAGGTYWLLVHGPQDPRTPVHPAALLRAVATTVGICLGLLGTGQLAGGSGVLGLGLVLLASPSVPGLVRRLLGRPSAAVAAPRPPVDSLTTEQLCSAWAASFDAVCDAADPHRMDVLASLRRDYLDELERRDPQGFDLWLALHARPGDDPRPHLSLEGGPGPTSGPTSGPVPG